MQSRRYAKPTSAIVKKEGVHAISCSHGNYHLPSTWETRQLFKVILFGMQWRDIWEVIVQLWMGDRYNMRVYL
jgi:hypothetical protein